MISILLLAFFVAASGCPHKTEEGACVGGHFTCLNISHSTCIECDESYEVNNTCVSHTYSHESQCVGGVWAAGTNTTDSTCVECIGSYESNNVCASYSMYWPWQCIGGILALGTNTTDSTCTECQHSFQSDVALNYCDPYSYTNPTCIGGQFIPGTNTTDSQCIPCNGTTRESDDGLSCQSWSHPTHISCLGGTWSAGTNVVDSVCYECPYGKMELDHVNACVDWQIQSYEECQLQDAQSIFVPGTNHTDAYCLECPTYSTFPFQNVCVDCLTIKTLFRSNNCCHGFDPFILRGPGMKMNTGLKMKSVYNDICMEILTRWKEDCQQTCNST